MTEGSDNKTTVFILWCLETPYGDMGIGQHWPWLWFCCLTASSYNLNQCWFESFGFLSKRISQEKIWHTCQNLHFKIIFLNIWTSPRGQWVNMGFSMLISIVLSLLYTESGPMMHWRIIINCRVYHWDKIIESSLELLSRCFAKLLTQL